ncbi:MAG: M81 family metallopeptidase, partial [Dongiaceae bacterium]
MKRLAVARLWHEGNSFSPVRTTLADFERREWVEGPAAREFYRGTATELGAAVAFADAHPAWGITFLRCVAAPPGGPVEESAFDAIRASLLDGVRSSRWDAVYLSPHGALVTDARPTAELDLLTDVRAAIGSAPLAISLDLHANIGAPLLGLVDVATGYKTYPHTDMDATGAKALRLLTDHAEGRSNPVGALVKLPAILSSFNMRTTAG